jgi:hypothetical protein
LSYSLIICDKHKHDFNLLIENLRADRLTDTKFHSIEAKLIRNIVNYKSKYIRELDNDEAGNRRVATLYFHKLVIITVIKRTKTMIIEFPEE